MPSDKDAKPACSTASAAVPLDISCSKCGADVEMWSDEKETECESCGANVRNS